MSLDTTLGDLLLYATRKASGTLTLNLDEIVIDTTGMSILTVNWVSFAGGFDGNAYLKVSNDGGATYQAAFTHGTIDNAWAADFFYLPNFASAQQYAWAVAGYDRAKVVLLDRTVGSAVIALQASAAPFQLPHQGFTIIDYNGKAVQVTAGGALKVETQTGSVGTFGTKEILVASAPAVAVVGVASALVTNAGRGLSLRNLSTARISLGFGAPAVLDQGDTLYPLDSWYMSEYNYTQQNVNAIASAAGSNLSVQNYT